MKRVRAVLRDLFIIICFFIPCIVVWLSRAVISLVGRVYTYVRSEWERFNDIYFDNMAVGRDVDPAFLVYMKGEDSVTGPCRCNHALGARNKIHQYFLVIVNSVANALLFVPEKIYASAHRVPEDYHNICGDCMVEQPYTEPAFIAYLEGEEGAPFLHNPRVTVSKSDSRDVKNFPTNSDIESRSQRQLRNGKVTEGLSLVRLVYKLYQKCRFSNGEKHLESSQEIKHPYFNERKAQNVDKAANVYYRQAVKLQETVPTHVGTVPSSPAFAVGSDHSHLFKCPGASRKAWNYPVNLRVPPNTSPKLGSSSLHFEAGGKQWNASPAVAKQKNT